MLVTLYYDTDWKRLAEQLNLIGCTDQNRNVDRLYSAEKLGSVICSYVCMCTSLCRYKALIRTQLKTKYHFFPVL